MSTPASVRLPAPELPAWLSEMLPFDRYLVDTGAWRMHVMEAGEGLPVVMVHGNPTWGFLYRKVAQELRNEFRVIMPDLYGLGLSDKPHSRCAHTIDGHAAALRSLLDKLRLPAFILVVQDWGGPIGVLAASMKPGQMVGLVVLNTVLGPPREGFRPTAFHRFAQLPVISDAVFRVGAFPQGYLHTAQGDKSSIRGRVRDAYTWPLRRFQDNKAPLALARLVPDSQEHPSIPVLKRIQEFTQSWQGPSAIVWGDRDPVLGRAFSRVQAVLPNAVVTRTQAGHFLQEEVPVEIAAAVRDVAARGRAV
jgi:pimeloyl-ACP methyl ester carboxylesterase